MTRSSQFRGFKTNPEIVRQSEMIYIRFALSLRNVQDVLNERSIPGERP